MQQVRSSKISKLRSVLLLAGLLLVVVALAAWGAQIAWAKPAAGETGQASPLHPTFPLLDEDGENAVDTGEAVSTMETCGACHDTDFIAEHSYHADVGLKDFSAPGTPPNGRPWDTSPGYFGKWNPMTYRYLSPQGDERVDLSTAEWLGVLGARHVGGGPGLYGRDGRPLAKLAGSPSNPETNTVDPETGELVLWDWEESGTVEMNCFLCHTPEPNNQARLQALKEGDFRWASTATLLGSGVVEQTDEGYQWNSEAFDENGQLAEEYVQIQDPTNQNCGQCHGLVHDDIEVPIVVTSCTPDRWRTETTGQIVSPQRISDTGMNLADKESLVRSWDIHAERLVECTDCHYSLNNPIYAQEGDETRPEHLLFDPRRLDLGQYLQQPLHQFARGQSAQSGVAPESKASMRRCESCHSVEATHDWLPYKERHVSALSCESCHIPRIYAFARQQYDWTVVRPGGEAHMQCRGIESDRPSLEMLATGYDPVMMPRKDVDGNSKLLPHNLVTSWFWVYGDPPRPVRLADLEAVWLDGDSYHAAVLEGFDGNGDGELDGGELMIDNAEKADLIAGRLEALDLENPHIVGEIQPYSINHTVGTGEWATRDCQTCHSDDSRLTQPIQLASYIPAGVMPEFVSDSNVSTGGQVYETEDGALFYKPATDAEGLYVLGHDNVPWVDRLGGLIFLVTLLAVVVHGGLRVWSAIRHPKSEPHLKRVYIYSVYNRLWHWLQTFVILGLIFTGLVIHKPELFGFLSFRYLVLVHNTMAAILVINAFLALFYHLASGEIQQFIPRPMGFFDQAILQAKFYLKGIFKSEEHPFEKTPEKKLNPLQQATYFGLLNVLLPLQVLTGALIWGAQRWPNISSALGGLSFLSPLHTLITWLLSSFIVAHVYLTTTGHSPMAAIQAMMFGWDEVEVHAPAEEESEIDYTHPTPVTQEV